jgi:hypothetical protein
MQRLAISFSVGPSAGEALFELALRYRVKLGRSCLRRWSIAVGQQSSVELFDGEAEERRPLMLRSRDQLARVMESEPAVEVDPEDGVDDAPKIFDRACAVRGRGPVLRRWLVDQA